VRFIKIDSENFINFDQVVRIKKGSKDRAILTTVSGGETTLDITFDTLAIMLNSLAQQQNGMERNLETLARSATFPTP